jgi:peptidoglycan-N-acetylglucosamine deacetylase
MKKTFVVLIVSCFLISANAQTNTAWNRKKCAVVLTYDDALNIDLTNVIPALDSVGLKGTFYISDYFNGLNAQIPGWRKAAAKGHELANHTLWHACEGGRVGREFVKDYDLRFYTVKRMVDEIIAMNNLLKAIDGKNKRTFAYPCGDEKIHDSSYIEPLKNEFVAARGVRAEMLPINKVDLYDIPCYMINGQTGEQLIDLVKQAEQKNTLLVFLFHGVGGEHSLNVSLEAHSKLLHYLKQNQKNIWTATMIDVAEYIRKQQAK